MAAVLENCERLLFEIGFDNQNILMKIRCITSFELDYKMDSLRFSNDEPFYTTTLHPTHGGQTKMLK